MDGTADDDFERLFLADVEDVDNKSTTSVSEGNSRSKSPPADTFEPEAGTYAEKNEDEWALLLESSRVVENTMLLFTSELQENRRIAQQPLVVSASWSLGGTGPKPSSHRDGLATPDPSAPAIGGNDQHWAPSATIMHVDRDETVRELLSEMVASVAFVCSTHYAPEPSAYSASPQKDYDETASIAVPSGSGQADFVGNSSRIEGGSEATGSVPQLLQEDYDSATSPSKINGAESGVSLPGSLKIESELNSIETSNSAPFIFADEMRVKVRYD
jgi:hypothetical protein